MRSGLKTLLRIETERMCNCNVNGALWTRIVKLDNEVRIDEFRCGEQEIDLWLQKEALERQEAGGCTVYAAIADDKRVIGFFSLSMHHLQKRVIPSGVSDTLEIGGDIPCVLLGRFGVSLHCRGEEYRRAGGVPQGPLLIREAIRKAKRLADSVGCRLMYVQALNDDLIGWYNRQGFISMPKNPRNMVLDLKKYSM